MHYNAGNTVVGGVILPRVPGPCGLGKSSATVLGSWVELGFFLCGCMFTITHIECEMHACRKIAAVKNKISRVPMILCFSLK